MVEEKPASVDPHQLLKALSPLLGPEGEIKGAAEMDRVMSLMKDAKKLVSRCIYMNILKATKNEEVLERCLGRGGWEMMYTWLQEAKEDDNTPFLIEMLHVYQNIPVTLEILKKNSAPKTIKSLSKSEKEPIKTMAKDIVDKWMKTISKPDSSHSDKKKHRDKDKDRHRSHHHSSSSSRSSKDSSSSNHSKDSKENADTSSGHKDEKPAASSRQERNSSTESIQSNSSKANKSKEGQPRTAKAPPSLYRSTGLEQETVLPPAKKKTTIGVVDKILGATKRASNAKLVGVPPEKKAKPTPPKVNAPNPASKIKIIPARPKPTVQVYDSSDFMDALSASTNHAAPRRKRKPSATTSTSPSGKKDPVSPTSKSATAKTLGGGQENGSRGNTSPPQPMDEDKADTVMPSFYKETMANDDDKNSEDVVMKEGKEDSEETGSTAAASDITSEDATATSSSNSGKKKKSVHWVPDDKLVSTFYFEMNEDERVNVNKIRAFEDVRRQELLMERQTMDATKRAQDVHGMCSWRRPPLISDIPTVVSPGHSSTEKETQRQREQSVLQALYFSKDMIPDSAVEPDFEALPAEVEEPRIIPLHDETGGGETFVDHSKTPLPKPGGMQPARPAAPAVPPPTSPQFSLPPDIANILGNMAQELTNGRPPPGPPPSMLPNAGPFPENVQQMLNSILDQNPATAQNEAMKAQLKMMMESGPIREQIQAWVSGQPPPHGMMNWPMPPLGPPGPPGPPPTAGGLLPHPNMPPASMLNHRPPPPMHGPPRGNPHYPPGPWGRGGPRMMGGPRGGPPRGGPRGGGRGGGSRNTPVLCRHFPNCQFGTECKFLHPGKNNTAAAAQP